MCLLSSVSDAAEQRHCSCLQCLVSSLAAFVRSPHAIPPTFLLAGDLYFFDRRYNWQVSSVPAHHTPAAGRRPLQHTTAPPTPHPSLCAHPPLTYLQVWACLGLMLFSAVLGGWSDLSFSATGYAWQMINCVFTAAYSLHLSAVVRTVSNANFTADANAEKDRELLAPSAPHPHGNGVAATSLGGGVNRLHGQVRHGPWTCPAKATQARCHGTLTLAPSGGGSPAHSPAPRPSRNPPAPPHGPPPRPSLSPGATAGATPTPPPAIPTTAPSTRPRPSRRAAPAA